MYTRSVHDTSVFPINRPGCRSDNNSVTVKTSRNRPMGLKSAHYCYTMRILDDSKENRFSSEKRTLYNLVNRKLTSLFFMFPFRPLSLYCGLNDFLSIYASILLHFAKFC